MLQVITSIFALTTALSAAIIQNRQGCVLCRPTNKKMTRPTTTADMPGLKEEMMMKSVSILKVIVSIILCVFVFLPLGCGSWQTGETAAESRRRHKRVLRINRQEMMSDIDKVLLLDKPSKLTDKRIP